MTTSTPRPSDVPLTEGEILAGKYRVERVLGRGGMGVVVAAQHIHLRQKVAIKFLLPDATQEVVERFLREARAAVRLKSEHVTRVLDVGELEGGAPFMVMEYLEGSDLSQVLKKRGPLSVEDAVDYVLQACEAIGEAHQLGIVHRDLKPANLFLTKGADGSAVVKVLDFGISKDTNESSAEEEMQLTRTRAVLGSPYYMAPEQMKSTRNVDARADIWSLGIILYQLLTKKVPYKAESFVALCIMVVNEDPPPPTTHRPDLPPGLEAAILRALRKKPDERYASVSELAAAIAPFGNAGAALSAERIARVQGAPLPSIERPTSLSIAPPASVTSGSVGSALSSGPSIPSVAAAMPASPTAAGSPTIPPPTSEQSGAAAATGSATGAAWTGAPTIQARRTGTKIIGVGAAVGALAIAAVVALQRGRGDVPASHPVNVAAAVTVVTAATADVPAAASGTANALHPGASSAAAPPPNVTAAETAAPLASGEPAPSARPGPKSATSATAKTAPPTTAALQPPAAALPPAAPTPPPAAPPAKKKNPLDMDLQ